MRKESLGLSFGGFSSGVGKLKEWKPRASLKQIFLQDTQPTNEIYRKLLRLWPDVSDEKFEEIVLEVDRERLNKVIELVELAKKPISFFTEFLERTCNYHVLDALYRYYKVVLPRALEVVEKINEELSVNWDYNIDGRKFRGTLSLFVDNEQKPLKIFSNKFDKPEIGSPFESWPCFKTIERKMHALKEICLSSRENLIELVYLNERYESLKNDYYKFDPQTFGIFFPTKFAYRLHGKLLYCNSYSIGCAFCPQGNHDLVLITLLEAKK